jgi:hypothetical protein
MTDTGRTYRLCEIPDLIGRGANQRQLLALLQAFQHARVWPRAQGSRWGRWVYTPGLVLRLALGWEAAHALKMGIASAIAAVRAATAMGLFVGDPCTAPERVLVWIHPDAGWEPAPSLGAAGLRALTAGAGVILNVSEIARGLALRASGVEWPPHAIDPDEPICRCRVEVTTTGSTVRAVLDEHTAASCREADGTPVAWFCPGEKPLAVAARADWRQTLESRL